MTGFVYRINSNFCNRYYIGSTGNIVKRFKQHIYKYTKNNNYMGGILHNCEFIVISNVGNRNDAYQLEKSLLYASRHDKNLINKYRNNNSQGLYVSEYLKQKERCLHCNKNVSLRNMARHVKNKHG